MRLSTTRLAVALMFTTMVLGCAQNADTEIAAPTVPDTPNGTVTFVAQNLVDHHPEVVARFRERWSEQDLNEARLRMARIPDGAELIQSATILAPGFKIGNVIVMAGVPSIMQAMMDIVSPKLKSGVRMLSESVRANAREGDIGGPLRAIAVAHPDTIIGSYPFMDEEQKPNTNLVVRSRDPEKLAAAMAAVKEMLAGLNITR